MCVVETLVTEVHSLKTKLNSACCEIENLQISHTSMQEELSSYKMRLIDLEARSRRQNLIFRNIPEPDEESWEQCEINLVSFIKDTMKLGDEANDIAFQRVHRLGKPKRGVAPNGQPWRPRPIIASFRDDKIKEKVLGLVGNIAGTPFRVSMDYPAEIRSARGRLWKEYRDAREAKMAAKIACPAKLVINGSVVRDEFPGWSQAISGTALEPVANHNATRPLRPNGLFRDIRRQPLAPVPDPGFEYDAPYPDPGPDTRAYYQRPRSSYRLDEYIGASPFVPGRGTMRPESADDNPTTATHDLPHPPPTDLTTDQQETNDNGGHDSEAAPQNAELPPLSETISSALNSTLDGDQ